MNSLFERNIWSDLMQWKQNYQRKPLIIRGARQVGKTTIIRQFGETYRHFIEFNLEKTENQKIIQQVDSAQRLIEVLSLQKNLSATEWKGTLRSLMKYRNLQKR